MKSNSHNACNSAGISRRAMFSAAVFLSFMSSVPVAIAAPAAGDVYVYRVINGYNRETVGKVEHRIDKIDGDRVAETVTTDVPALGLSHTDVFNKEGNWLRHPLTIMISRWNTNSRNRIRRTYTAGQGQVMVVAHQRDQHRNGPAQQRSR